MYVVFSIRIPGHAYYLVLHFPEVHFPSCIMYVADPTFPVTHFQRPDEKEHNDDNNVDDDDNKCFGKQHIPSYGPCWRP